MNPEGRHTRSAVVETVMGVAALRVWRRHRYLRAGGGLRWGELAEAAVREEHEPENIGQRAEDGRAEWSARRSVRAACGWADGERGDRIEGGIHTRWQAVLAGQLWPVRRGI